MPRRQVPIAEDLRYLAAEAGFSAVDVRVSGIDAHLPRLAKFVLDHLAATPVDRRANNKPERVSWVARKTTRGGLACLESFRPASCT
jgi:hypothetical protein